MGALTRQSEKCRALRYAGRGQGRGFFCIWYPEMGMSVDSVYAAKNRCLTQLREILARLNEVYEVA